MWYLICTRKVFTGPKTQYKSKKFKKARGQILSKSKSFQGWRLDARQENPRRLKVKFLARASPLKVGNWM